MLIQKISLTALAALAITAGIHTTIALAHDKNQAAVHEYIPADTKTLSLTDLEAIVVSKGIRSSELKIQGLLLEVEGQDAQGQEVELILDRRSGDIMHFEYDD